MPYRLIEKSTPPVSMFYEQVLKEITVKVWVLQLQKDILIGREKTLSTSHQY